MNFKSLGAVSAIALLATTTAVVGQQGYNGDGPMDVDLPPPPPPPQEIACSAPPPPPPQQMEMEIHFEDTATAVSTGGSISAVFYDGYLNDDVVEMLPSPQPVSIPAPCPAQNQASTLNGIINNLGSGRLPLSTALPDGTQAGGGLLAVAPANGNVDLGSTDISFNTANLNAHERGGASALSVWSQLRFTQLTSDRTGIEGPVFDGRIGLEYEVDKGVYVGGHASFLYADVESTTLSTSVEEARFGGGLHVRLDLDENLSATVNAMAEAGNADIVSFGGSGSANVARLALIGSLNGVYDIEGFIVAPRVAAGIVYHRRSGYTNSFGTTIASDNRGEFYGNVGTQVGYAFATGDVTVPTVTPYLDLGLTYKSDDDADMFTTTGSVINDKALSGSVQLGVNASIAGDGFVALQGGVLGLGRDTYGWTGTASVNIPLN